MSDTRSKFTGLGSMQKRAFARLTAEWQSVTDVWDQLRTGWRGKGPLDRLRVANALRGMRKRGLIAARRVGSGPKAPWEYRLCQENVASPDRTPDSETATAADVPPSAVDGIPLSL